jgi:succinyl-CoA synthetase alpha subunit
MNLERVDFMKGIHLIGIGSVTSVGVGKEGVVSITYNDATGMVTVDARGKRILVPLTNIAQMLAPPAQPATAPTKK